MVKLTGPALGTEAIGALADTLTFAKSKKHAYLKKHASPKNPKTPAQVSVRVMIRFLSQNWALLTPLQKATWNTPAFLQNFAPYHAFLQINMERWKTFRGPGKTYPVPDTAPTGATIYQVVFGGVASIDVRLSRGGGTPPWGYMTFRQPIDFNPPQPYMCVNVTRSKSVGFTWWKDTPLVPGNYWYRTVNFTDDGQMRFYGASDMGTAT